MKPAPHLVYHRVDIPGAAATRRARSCAQANRRGARLLARACTPLLAVAALLFLAPAPAQAHGALDPEASANLAHVISSPPGTVARVVDGDLRLWMAVDPGSRVVVLDYQGGRYLRFDRAGVQVNENSPMFYLNLTPPGTPPTRLTASTPPAWHQVSDGHSYQWHDGRIGALASSWIAPGSRYLGRWTIRATVDGAPALIAGRIYHAPPPSLAWLWPIALALLTLPALLRLRNRRLEQRVCRALAAVALLGAATLAVGAGLHGRPGLSAAPLAMLAVELALFTYAGVRLVRGRAGLPVLALVAVLAGYRGIAGLAVLWRGYVLLALPAPLARAAVTVCLATSISLALVIITHVDQGLSSTRRERPGQRARV